MKSWMRDQRRWTKYTFTGKSDAEIAVLEATNGEKWGPTPGQLHRIERMVRHSSSRQDVSKTLWKRIGQRNYVRHVHKALLVLEHLIKNGSETIRTEARQMLVQLQSLAMTEKTKTGDDGAIQVAIKKKAQQLVELISDDELYQQEREKARVIKDKMGKHSRDARTAHDDSAVRYGTREPIQMKHRGSDVQDDMQRRRARIFDPHGEFTHPKEDTNVSHSETIEVTMPVNPYDSSSTQDDDSTSREMSDAQTQIQVDQPNTKLGQPIQTQQVPVYQQPVTVQQPMMQYQTQSMYWGQPQPVNPFVQRPFQPVNQQQFYGTTQAAFQQRMTQPQIPQMSYAAQMQQFRPVQVQQQPLPQHNMSQKQQELVENLDQNALYQKQMQQNGTAKTDAPTTQVAASDIIDLTKARPVQHEAPKVEFHAPGMFDEFGDLINLNLRETPKPPRQYGKAIAVQ